MPTVYVDNLSKLQRLTDSGFVKITRPVVNVVKSVAGFEGEGFPGDLDDAEFHSQLDHLDHAGWGFTLDEP